LALQDPNDSKKSTFLIIWLKLQKHNVQRQNFQIKNFGCLWGGVDLGFRGKFVDFLGGQYGVYGRGKGGLGCYGDVLGVGMGIGCRVWAILDLVILVGWLVIIIIIGALGFGKFD
jgi:hypothetical protein